jgi:hypothetical protein
MIKIKDLRAMAHKRKLKLSESAYSEANRLAEDVVAIACTKAINRGKPKLEARDFASILVLPEGGKPLLKKAKGK